MSPSYDGNYSCIAKNIKGNDSATFNLTGQGKVEVVTHVFTISITTGMNSERMYVYMYTCMHAGWVSSMKEFYLFKAEYLVIKLISNLLIPDSILLQNGRGKSDHDHDDAVCLSMIVHTMSWK